MFESALGKAPHVYHGCKVIVTKKLDELLFGTSTRPHGIDGRFSQPRDTPSNPQLARAPCHKCRTKENPSPSMISGPAYGYTGMGYSRKRTQYPL